MANKLIQLTDGSDNITPQINHRIYQATSKQGSGAVCNYTMIGNLVIAWGTITKPNTTWTIFEGLPSATNTHIAGVVGNIDTISHNIWIVNSGGGYIQVRDGTFSDTYDFCITYMKYI